MITNSPPDSQFSNTHGPEQPLQSEPTGARLPDTPPAPPEKRIFVGTGLFWGLAIGILVAVAFIILAAQNTDETRIAFLNWSIATPLIAVILVSFLAGVVVDEITGLVYRARRRRVLHEREELRELRDHAPTG
jgi:uncharacterized integral membrane protein